MGRVFRAQDLELQRTVALKFLLLPEARSEGPAVSLLKQEARAVAQLAHESIVRIFDVSEWRSAPWEPRIPFLVMEYLEGESLASLLRRETPGLRRTLALMGRVAAGLAHAHAHHITHRDLKPGNVFLTREGGVKLLDFGLAYHAAGSTSHIPSLPTSGTPPYMAPEQWRGEEQDERADIWAAGVMLYELLTGKHPYPAASLEELRAQVISPKLAPPLRAHGTELPMEVEQLVAAMLAKAPAQRLRSAAELQERLRRLEEGLGPWQEALRPLKPERRQVTLVFCRLSVLAEPTKQLDPEDSSEFQAAFHQYCSEVIRSHGGSTALSVGDEVLACFGHPEAHEDDSARAVRAALHLSQSFSAGKVPELLRGGLAVQIGVHTGPVVFDSIALERQGRMPTLQGEAPRMTAWLARQARASAVVLSGTTWLMVRGSFDTRFLGSCALEAQPGGQRVDLHSVLRERRTTSRFEQVLATRGLTPLVGRGPELERLLALWKQARQGEGAFVLLSGEAGIGKSRLIQELRERAFQEPSHVLRIQCWSQHQLRASHPAVEMLQRFFQLELQGSLQQELHGMESLVEKLCLPLEPICASARFFSGPSAGEPDPTVAQLEQMKECKRQVLELTRELLLRIAEDRPVLLSLEDLHWADPSTLELLGFLRDHLEQSRILILLSARPEFHPPWPLCPWSHRIVLDRLPPESTAALARAVASDRSLPEEMVRQLVARTDGVPLFVEELTRMVLERAPSEFPAAIPVTLHELLLARLDALPLRQKALAQLCATVGRSFSHALVSQLAADDAASLRRDLSGLLSTGLLQRESSGGLSYVFRHALIQEAAYQSLPRGTRRQHHRRIAQTLVEQFPEMAEARPELLAHHLTEAGEYEPAIRSWKRATEHAILRSAGQEAVAHLKQALALLRSLPDTSEHRGEELQLLNALGSVLIDTQGYGSAEMEQLYEQALQLFRQLEEPPPASPFWMGLGAYFVMRGRLKEVRELAERFMVLGERRQEPGMQMQGCWLMADLFLLKGESARALELFTQVGQYLDLARPSGAPSQRTFEEMLWGEAQMVRLMFMSLAHSMRGELEQAWQCSQEALRTLRKLDNPATTASGLIYLAGASQIRREVQCTLEWSEEGSAQASGIWLRPLRAGGEALRGWALFKAGQVREGLEVLRGNCEQLRELGSRAFLPFMFSMIGEVYLELGQALEGLAVVAEALQLAEETGAHFFDAELHRLQSELLRVAGREEEARFHLLRARLVARRQQATLFELRATVSLGRQLRDQGHREAARRRLERICGRFGPGLPLADLQEAQALLDGL
jgi:serine/threonine protein kinase/tetratricopeptide (TPR) repeat protein